MKIAQVSPLHERVPPRAYGGTERVVSYLTEELVARDHEVTLFASGDSETSAHLVPCSMTALRSRPECVDRMAYHILQLESVRQRANEFDIIHFHIDYLHYPLSRAEGWNCVTTLHGRLDLPDLVPLYQEFDDAPIVSISLSQRTPLPWSGWVGNIPHGLPPHLFRYNPEPEGYLACLCRFSPEKAPDKAVEIAGRAGVPIRLAGKVDAVDREYFEDTIEPLRALEHVEITGEIAGREKEDFLANARAVLFPIDWPEPFGLVMIEALACGTPVIAFDRGSVPEVIEDGKTGFIVRSVSEAAEAVGRLDEISRETCRLEFERRFSANRMADDYVRLYERLLARPVERREGSGSASLRLRSSPADRRMAR